MRCRYNLFRSLYWANSRDRFLVSEFFPTKSGKGAFDFSGDEVVDPRENCSELHDFRLYQLIMHLELRRCIRELVEWEFRTIGDLKAFTHFLQAIFPYFLSMLANQKKVRNFFFRLGSGQLTNIKIQW